MAKNVTVAGASFTAVPSVDLPQTGGGTARFYDCTGSKNITENGTVDVTGLASVVVNVASGGGGIAGITELYSNDAVSITYTSTSAGTAKSITGLTGLATYPFIVVEIDNTDADTAAALKFRRSVSIIGNNNWQAGSVTVTRYAIQHYYNSSKTATQAAGTSYGLWGYTISTAGALTIRGRCNSAYYTSLTGTYKIRVLGVKL